MNNIPESQEKRNLTTTPELFPELKGLKGGKKQEWINSHLDVIAAMAEVIQFDDLCKLLNTKADTLTSALRRAEGHHRPMVTKADKAMLQARQIDNRLSEALGELSLQAAVIASQDAEIAEMKDNLSRYFEMMAQTSTMMAKMMAKPTQYRTLRNIYLVRTRSKSVQLTHKASVRLLNAVPESCNLSGQVVKRSLRHSKQPFKRRLPNV